MFQPVATNVLEIFCTIVNYKRLNTYYPRQLRRFHILLKINSLIIKRAFKQGLNSSVFFDKRYIRATILHEGIIRQPKIF